MHAYTAFNSVLKSRLVTWFILFRSSGRDLLQLVMQNFKSMLWKCNEACNCNIGFSWTMSTYSHLTFMHVSTCRATHYAKKIHLYFHLKACIQPHSIIHCCCKSIKYLAVWCRNIQCTCISCCSLDETTPIFTNHDSCTFMASHSHHSIDILISYCM